MQTQPDSAQGKDVATGWCSARNMSIWSGRLMFDIMGDIAFGNNFGVLESNSNRQIIDTISDGVHGLNLVG